MKAKKFNKKLVLNKETIANLVNVEMNGLKAGGDGDTLTLFMPTCCCPTQDLTGFPCLRCPTGQDCISVEICED